MKKQDYESRIMTTARLQFKRQYEQDYPRPAKRTPPPLPQRREIDPPKTLRAFWKSPLAWVFIVLSFAAAWLSALRTVAVFSATGGSSLEGNLAMLVVEGSALMLSLFMVLEAYQRSNKLPASGSVSNSIKAVVFMAIVVGLITNTYDIFLRQGQVYSEITLVVFILTGSIATVTLAVLGHALGVIYVWHLESARQDNEDYQEAVAQANRDHADDLANHQAILDDIERYYLDELNEYNARFEAAWKANERDWYLMVANTVNSARRTTEQPNDRTEPTERHVAPERLPAPTWDTSPAMASHQPDLAEQQPGGTMVFGRVIKTGSAPAERQAVVSADGSPVRPNGRVVNQVIDVLLAHPDLLTLPNYDAMVADPRLNDIIKNRGETLTKAVSYVKGLGND